MSALSLARIRGRVRAAIQDLAGGVPSPLAPDLFGREAQSLAHRAYAVTIAGTTPLPDRQSGRGAQGPASAVLPGCPAETVVRVRWAYRLRSDAASSDYDAALRHEQEVLAAALRGDRLEAGADEAEPRFRLTYERTLDRVQVGDYLVSTFELSALHWLELSLASERAGGS